MGEPLTTNDLCHFGEIVLEAIEGDLGRGWLVDEQDVEMLEQISGALEKRGLLGVKRSENDTS